MKVTATLYCAVALAITASGCAPMWPSMMTDRELKTPGGQELNCHVEVSLPKAFECLNAAREEMNRGIHEIGQYERAFGYTAVLGGTAAGYQLTKVAPKEANAVVLRNIGIALAALVGLDKVVAPETQLSAYEAGTKALLCVDQAARGVQVAKERIVQRNTGQYGTFMSKRPAELAAMYTSGIQNHTHQLYMNQRLTHLFLTYQSDRTDLVRAAESAAEGKTLAERIRSSVVRIRSAVLAQLGAKKIDMREILKEQQLRVGEIVGEIVGSAQRANTSANNLNVFIVAADGPPHPTPTEEVRPATDAYEACIAPLPK